MHSIERYVRLCVSFVTRQTKTKYVIACMYSCAGKAMGCDCEGGPPPDSKCPKTPNGTWRRRNMWKCDDTWYKNSYLCACVKSINDLGDDAQRSEMS